MEISKMKIKKILNPKICRKRKKKQRIEQLENGKQDSRF